MCPSGKGAECSGSSVGPLDERPDENGVRLRDTQCGLFATGKVLRRFRIPFTYMTNCRLNDPVFERWDPGFYGCMQCGKEIQKYEDPSDFHKTF